MQVYAAPLLSAYASVKGTVFLVRIIRTCRNVLHGNKLFGVHIYYEDRIVPYFPDKVGRFGLSVLFRSKQQNKFGKKFISSQGMRL